MKWMKGTPNSSIKASGMRNCVKFTQIINNFVKNFLGEEYPRLRKVNLYPELMQDMSKQFFNVFIWLTNSFIKRIKSQNKIKKKTKKLHNLKEQIQI